MTPARSCQLLCDGGIRAALTHYAPGLVQPAHYHDFSQLSFLLAGQLRERVDRHQYEVERAAVSYKPAGSIHENEWGREGVLMFSVNLPAAETDCLAGRAPGWAPLNPTFPVAAIVRTCFEAGAGERDEAIQDLLALATAKALRAGPMPPWLTRAREALWQDASLTVSELALVAGVHRAHFARMFHRHFGVPPSVYRRKLLAARAVAVIARSATPLSAVAQEAGFSDHAHMSRTLRTEIGLSPRYLRSMLEQSVTSIQDDLTAGS